MIQSKLILMRKTLPTKAVLHTQSAENRNLKEDSPETNGRLRAFSTAKPLFKNIVEKHFSECNKHYIIIHIYP